MSIAALRTLHVLRSKSWGGLEMYTLDFITHMVKAGVPCELLCLPNTPVQREAEARGIPVTFEARRLRAREIKRVHVHRRQDLTMARFRLLFQSKPLFYSLYMSAPPKRDAYHAWIYKRIAGMASSSEWVNAQAKKNFPLDPRKIHLVRYGRKFTAAAVADRDTNTKDASLHTKREEMHTNDDKVVIGSLSRIDPGKGVVELLEACVQLPENLRRKVELWIIGDPTIEAWDDKQNPIYEPESKQAYERLQALAQSPELSGLVHLIPFQKDPAPWLAGMDIFYLGSHEETYSLAVLDAMGFGLPVLGSDSGGTTEQIGKDQQRGYLFTPKSISDLNRTLLEILQSPASERTQKGAAAKEWVFDQHNWDKCLQAWFRIYNEGRR